MKTLLENADNARSLIKHVAPRLIRRGNPYPQGCQRALEHALITPPEARDPDLVGWVDAVAGRVLK